MLHRPQQSTHSRASHTRKPTTTKNQSKFICRELKNENEHSEKEKMLIYINNPIIVSFSPHIVHQKKTFKTQKPTF